MFANFFGIVIISASVLLIAGLVLRSAPDLPAKMNLGLVDKLNESTLTTSDNANSSDSGTSQGSVDTSNNTETGESTTETNDTATSSTTENTAATDDAAADATDAGTAVSTSSEVATQATENAADSATDSQAQTTQESNQTSDAPKTESSDTGTQGFSKVYLERKKRAAEISGSAPARTNKSDAVKYRDN